MLPYAMRLEKGEFNVRKVHGTLSRASANRSASALQSTQSEHQISTPPRPQTWPRRRTFSRGLRDAVRGEARLALSLIYFWPMRAVC
jgi:hypothetical protein